MPRCLDFVRRNLPVYHRDEEELYTRHCWDFDRKMTASAGSICRDHYLDSYRKTLYPVGGYPPFF